MTNHNVPERSNDLERWTDTLQLEISNLLVQASELQTKISTAKTSTKQQFYKKKFATVKNVVNRYNILLSQLESKPVCGITNEQDTSAQR